MAHRCHAEGCRSPVKPEFLMCPRHWRQVPDRVQQAVWNAYRPGQCDDKKPSVAWCIAADEAVAAVAKKEKRAVRRTFLQAFHPEEHATRSRPPAEQLSLLGGDPR